MRALHRDLHLERPRPCGGEALQDGGRSGLHEMHGLHQRLPERRACTIGWGKPSIVVPRSKAVPRNYSLTWPEEISAASFFSGVSSRVRAVYGLVPFLMALGCAAVTTFLALKTWRLLRTDDVYFHRFHLKFVGKLHKGGVALPAGRVFVAWTGRAQRLDSLSGVSWRGGVSKTPNPRRVALAQANPDVLAQSG